MPGLQARIIREDGTDGGVGESGELWVKGGCVFPRVTSMTNRPLRRRSPKMGGSRLEISSLSMRREITSEISRGSCLTCILFEVLTQSNILQLY